MAEEETGASSPSAAEHSAPDDEVELLVQGRAKRATAGNRLSSLLTVEQEADDVVELLFAEQEGEDEDFESEPEHGSDAEMDSSSDSDAGPAAGADDLDGERELERQAKAERKAARAKLAAGPRRLPRRRLARAAGPSAAMAPPPKPAKKSERTTWLLPADGAAVRASSRKQTVQNKEVTQLRIAESESRRARTLQAMEAASRKKEAAAARSRTMTQDERLAEAARVERVNARSLNRWQADEARRAEERLAKLAALKDRKLDGAYVTVWSGPAVWVDGKLRGAGAKQIEDVTASEEAKLKARAERVVKDREEAAAAEARAAEMPESGLADQEMADAMSGVAVDGGAPGVDADKMDTAPDEQQQQQQHEEPNVEQPSNQPTPEVASQQEPSVEQSSERLAPTDGTQAGESTKQPSEQPTAQETQTRPSADRPSEQPTPQADTLMQDSHVATPEVREPKPDEPQAAAASATPQPSAEPAAEERPSTPQPPLIEIASRTLVALHNVDSASFPHHILAHTAAPRRKNARMTGKQPVLALCPVTGQPAKFRDPQSGVPYQDIWAFNQIRRLYRPDEDQAAATDGARFNELLGCFVGGTRVAKGVPDRFPRQRQDQAAWMVQPDDM